MNTLYYGDNLDILRHHVKDETVDLVYLDPPFKSNQDYNILFQEQDGTRSASQILAFDDTWRWDMAAETAYRETVEAGGRVSEALQAFRMFLGENDMMSYLAMMAPRLVELRRVLKPTGSIYLHCDPAASHYLKMLLDAVFKPENFRNEIIWKRSHPHGNIRKKLGSIHDTIFSYRKSSEATWHQLFKILSEEDMKKRYPFKEAETERRYQTVSLLNPNPNRPNLTYEWNGHNRVWKWTSERMQAAHDADLLVYSSSGLARYKDYADEGKGNHLQDVWDDIEPVSGGESLGYPTQKPDILLERILRMSSNEGDLILDPFCGCGTAIAVAQRLNRRWIGIDITHLAIAMIKHRMHHAFGDSADYRVIGEPVSLPDAQTLATQDPFQFQCWAVSLVAGRPVESKKGADKGIDGKLFFIDDPEGKKTQQIILSVKAGHTNVAHVRDLRGVVDREKAAIGALISMQEPTQPMRIEAASAGFYDSAIDWGRRFPKIQLLTIRELLDGKRIDMPPQQQVNQTFRKARRAKDEAPEQLTLE